MSAWAEHTVIKSSKNENESTPSKEISDIKTIIPNLNKDENKKVEDFLNLLKEHQEHPLEAYMGPTLKEFNLSKSPIGLVGKAEKGIATLYIFNWKKEPVAGMIENPELSQRMGRKVYELKNINTQNIDSQQGRGEILGFTYLQGARFRVPLPFNSNYFDKKHPLRVALGPDTMPIYSPDETPIRKLFPTETFYRKQFPKGSGNVFFETFIHESFHVIEGDKNREEHPPYGKTTGKKSTTSLRFSSYSNFTKRKSLKSHQFHNPILKKKIYLSAKFNGASMSLNQNIPKLIKCSVTLNTPKVLPIL